MLVRGIRSFSEEAFELEPFCNLEKLFLRSLQLLGEADILGSFLEDLGEQLPSFDKRARAQIGVF